MKNWYKNIATVGIAAFIILSNVMAWKVHWFLGGCVALFYLYIFIEVCLDRSQE